MAETIPYNYVFPTNSRRQLRLFTYAFWTPVNTPIAFYTVPQDKVYKIQNVIITSCNGNWIQNNIGIFLRSSDGSEICSFSRSDGAPNYQDTVYTFDEKLVLMGGDTISSYSINAVGMGAFIYAVIIGIEEQNPFLTPTLNK